MAPGESSAAAQVPVRPAGALAALGDTELRRWHLLCSTIAGSARHPWPEDEARVLVDAVLAALFHEDDSRLAEVARVFARATASLPLLVRRLGCLREVLVQEGLVDSHSTSGRLQGVLDKVTTLATETALGDLEDAALTDALTGVGNRRALDGAARAALASAQRAGTALSIVVIDLDGLKAINDGAGHAAGDRALAAMSGALRSALRETDQVFRVGGDEFVVLLPLAPPETVAPLMERAARLEAPRFSWGAAGAPSDGTDLDTLLAAADSRLYAARRGAGYPGHRPGETARVPWRPPVRPPAARHRGTWRLVVGGLVAAGAVAAFAWLSPTSGAGHHPGAPPGVSRPAPSGR